jgi:predicted HAD superfamily phosphohydrolase YqeG
MRILNKIIFLGLFLIQGYLFADKTNSEEMKQEWLKKVKENNFHLKQARKNLRVGIKVLKNDLDVPVSGDAKKLIKWALEEYFYYLQEHKKLYS